MTLKSRHYLFIISLFLFIVLTIYISLYATGYRLNLTWPLNFSQLLQKTGMLILATKPEEATVNLEKIGDQSLFGGKNKLTEKNYKTPVKIKDLLPGEYELKLELTGYWPYSKNINIYPGESTYVEDINLFKKDVPLKITDAKTQKLELTADKQYLIVKEENKIINLKTDELINALPKIENPKDKPTPKIIKDKNVKFITWIDDKRFLYATDWEIYLFDVAGDFKTLVTRISKQITSLNWQSEGYIIYSTKNAINLIDSRDWENTATLITLEKMAPPILNKAGDALYFTAKIGQSEGLYKLSIK